VAGIIDKVEDDLAHHGWRNRAKAIVLDPELEAWVWSESPHVGGALGWEDTSTQAILEAIDHAPPSGVKPAKPKEAMEKALRMKGIPRSSSIYGQLASSVGLSRCTDPAFLRLRGILLEWFPA